MVYTIDQAYYVKSPSLSSGVVHTQADEDRAASAQPSHELLQVIRCCHGCALLPASHSFRVVVPASIPPTLLTVPSSIHLKPIAIAAASSAAIRFGTTVFLTLCWFSCTRVPCVVLPGRFHLKHLSTTLKSALYSLHPAHSLSPNLRSTSSPDTSYCQL